MFPGLLSVLLFKPRLGKGLKAFLLCTIALFVVFSTLEATALATQDNPATLQPAALEYTGTYELRESDPNLTGSGVTIAALCRSLTYIDGQPQNDYRPNTAHKCLEGRRIAFYDSNGFPAGISSHSTAISSILIGSDANGHHPKLGRFHYQGAAPDANVDVYEFWHFVINNVFAGTAPTADIITMSIGSQFEDWWTRGIESMVEKSGIVVVAGIGNGSIAYDPVLYPAAAANVLGVGVVSSVKTKDVHAQLANFTLPVPEYSSKGPTADGRCKPDIVAPGNCLVAEANNPNGYEITGSFSSLATPVVAGTIGLLIQKAKEDPNLIAAVTGPGGNCVIKAILMNSARKLPYWHKGGLGKADDHDVPLDYVQGAGILDAVRAYEHLVAGPMLPGRVASEGWDRNEIDETQNSQRIYMFSLAEPADKFITATLVWNRHFEDKYPFEAASARGNNLRLELWAIDTNNPQNDYLLDYSDSRVDNVEHIYFAADANYSEYELIVSFSDDGRDDGIDRLESYALAWKVGKGLDTESILWYDLNFDGIVNDADIGIMLNNFTESLKGSQGYMLGDINMDGQINFKDLQLLMTAKKNNYDTLSR